MGLLDQVIGTVVGNMTGRPTEQMRPRTGAPDSGGGLGGLLGGAGSPIVMGILALLASKHLKSGAGGYGSSLRDMMGGGGGSSSGGLLGGLLGGGSSSQQASGMGGGMGGGQGGGLGGLGGMLAGAGAGSLVSGGLGHLLERFQQSGHGDKMNSWISSGANQDIAPHELEQAIGPEDVEELARETGMSRDEFLSQMSQALPQVVDGLTPGGRVPTPDDQTQWV
jgi:uncharacterized protein YidB (DUF937 family)